MYLKYLIDVHKKISSNNSTLALKITQNEDFLFASIMISSWLGERGKLFACVTQREREVLWFEISKSSWLLQIWTGCPNCIRNNLIISFLRAWKNRLNNFLTTPDEAAKTIEKLWANESKWYSLTIFIVSSSYFDQGQHHVVFDGFPGPHQGIKNQ